MSDDLSSFSMQELFRMEAEAQATILTDGLLALEKDPGLEAPLEALMRAAHSIKGAARVIGLEGAVRIAHQMEDCFVAAQQGKIDLGAAHIDILLRGVDMLTTISNLKEDEITDWFAGHMEDINALENALQAMSDGGSPGALNVKGEEEIEVTPATEQEVVKPAPEEPGGAQATDRGESKERLLHLSSEHFNRMLALASEAQVEWQWLTPFSDDILQIKRNLIEIERLLLNAELAAIEEEASPAAVGRLTEIRHKLEHSRNRLASSHGDLELHSGTISNLNHRLYHQTVNSRMQPFADGTHGLKRLVRDLGRDLGKQVRLEISGLDTSVDRDILEQIKSPLNHLIRNAVDHGIETPEVRRELGKPEEGVVQLEAVHQSGMLRVRVSDDGCGLDPDALRGKVVDRGLASKEMAMHMTEAELTAFLFLPKFTMKDEVTEISGRGVGLDVVASMVRDVRGTIGCTTRKNVGMRFDMHLPITLSLIRALLVEIAGEPYAFPLVHVQRAVECQPEDIERIEGRQYFNLDGQQIGLVSAAEVLGLSSGNAGGDRLPVIVIGPVESRYGLIVDAFLGEHSLVEKRLHPRLGKVKDISSAAVTNEGAPLLIFDVNDLLVSIARLVSSGQLGRMGEVVSEAGEAAKRILVVDDSITVREVERKLLVSAGYQVEVAVDGMDGLNSARAGNFDLIVTDVDMPRMDGIELVTQIKQDVRLRNTPIVVVSYKESDEDRMRGLEAGADSYLTKSSFHDETLLETVANLIGSAV